MTESNSELGVVRRQLATLEAAMMDGLAEINRRLDKLEHLLETEEDPDDGELAACG
jgi:hypothetical protein